MDADGKGIRLRNYEYDSERLFRWTEVEQRLGRMIRENRYLTAEEQESLQPVSGTEPVQVSRNFRKNRLKAVLCRQCPKMKFLLHL